MKIIQICPRCGQPGVKVNTKAVNYNLIIPPESESDIKLRWHACLNAECKCSYFSKDQEFTVSDLVRPLFYKDISDNVPVCYCSDLTRGEIKIAVERGCTSIGKVQKFTKKNITGHCEKMNPLGKCCKQVFQRIIKENNKKV
jgi:bacterioferritin-associated ferredoxin